jgi:hypothetical protein
MSAINLHVYQETYITKKIIWGVGAGVDASWHSGQFHSVNSLIHSSSNSSSWERLWKALYVYRGWGRRGAMYSKFVYWDQSASIERTGQVFWYCAPNDLAFIPDNGDDWDLVTLYIGKN